MKTNTKLLMASSAASLAFIGLCLTFLATEIADYFLLSSTIIFQLFIQILGALYFAFAMLNWMAKGNVIGGIYNRPIVIANVAHFLIGGLALMKSLMKHPELPWVIWTVSGLYIIFALLFGLVLFGSPVSKKESIAVN
jgi:hypothetical protein